MCLPVVVDEEAENEEQEITCSYLPVPHFQAGKEDLIRSAINGENALDWPYMGETSMNEFRTPSLAGMSFPSTGRGYPTDPTRIHAAELSTNWKHLLRYADVHPHCCDRWRLPPIRGSHTGHQT